MPLLPILLRTVASRRSALAVAVRGQHCQQWRHFSGALHTVSWHARFSAAPPRGIGVGWTPLERLMRRGMQSIHSVAQRHAVAVTHQHVTRWSITLVPQFVLRVQRHTTSVRVATLQRPVAVFLRPVQRVLSATGTPGVGQGAAAASAHPRAISGHSSPATTPTVLRQAASRHSVAATPFARLPLTLVRHAAAASGVTQRPPDTALGTDANAAPRRPQSAPWSLASAPMSSLPAQEVQRLTDHVMAQLDRRALSWRERTQA